MYVFLLLKDIDECVNHTCQNGGSCKDGVNNYSCNCLPGFTGDRCQSGRYFKFFFVLSLRVIIVDVIVVGISVVFSAIVFVVS